MVETYGQKVLKWFVTIALFSLLIFLLAYLSDVLIPFVVALLIAYFMDPLVTSIENKVKNRMVAVGISLLLVFVLISGFFVVIIPQIISEIKTVSQLMISMIQDAHLTERAQQYLDPKTWAVVKKWLSDLNLFSIFQDENLSGILIESTKKIVPGIWGLFSGAMSLLVGVFGLFIIVLYIIFILLDFTSFRSNWIKLIPPTYQPLIEVWVNEFGDSLNTYFRTQALIAFIVGCLFAIGFSIIGLPMGIALGLMIGVLNMVPYLQLVSIPPALFLAFSYSLETGESFWWMAGLVVLVFIIVQVIQDAILVPKLMGKAMGLNPAMILLSLSIWGKILGMLGLLLAIPMTILILSIYRSLIKTKVTTHASTVP